MDEFNLHMTGDMILLLSGCCVTWFLKKLIYFSQVSHSFGAGELCHLEQNIEVVQL